MGPRLGPAADISLCLSALGDGDATVSGDGNGRLSSAGPGAARGGSDEKWGGGPGGGMSSGVQTVGGSLLKRTCFDVRLREVPSGSSTLYDRYGNCSVITPGRQSVDRLSGRMRTL